MATILLHSVLIGPLACVYVDKFNRRDIILVSDISRDNSFRGRSSLHSRKSHLSRSPSTIVLVRDSMEILLSSRAFPFEPNSKIVRDRQGIIGG
jgi:hypothetical protein